MTGSTASALMGGVYQECMCPRRTSSSGDGRALLPLVSQQCPDNPMHTTKSSSMTMHCGARVRTVLATLGQANKQPAGHSTAAFPKPVCRRRWGSCGFHSCLPRLF